MPRFHLAAPRRGACNSVPLTCMASEGYMAAALTGAVIILLAAV